MSLALRIAYGDASEERARSVDALLRAAGHELVVRPSARAFLSEAEPDLYLLGDRVADGTTGLELLRALRGSGRTAPIVLLAGEATFPELRRAIELGVTEVVLRPLDGAELTGAIERAAAEHARRPRIDAEPRAHSCELSYVPDASTVGRAARELSAFLVNEGVAGAHRVRIASAVAELVDNACRHGLRGTTGEVSVHATVLRTQVQLVVEDTGKGFDPARIRLDRVPAALPRARGAAAVVNPSSGTGLGRVERLCEAHTISSGPDGTRVELVFELTPVRFDEEGEHLGQTDFIDPDRARSLIATLRAGRADLSGVPPALALTIGRILGGLDAEVRPPSRDR
jgi:anti-sigma regulatory factor (Ser/Thr protein kinase)/CheY-like chemotaxis protein